MPYSAVENEVMQDLASLGYDGSYNGESDGVNPKYHEGCNDNSLSVKQIRFCMQGLNNGFDYLHNYLEPICAQAIEDPESVAFMEIDLRKIAADMHQFVSLNGVYSHRIEDELANISGTNRLSDYRSAVAEIVPEFEECGRYLDAEADVLEEAFVKIVSWAVTDRESFIRETFEQLHHVCEVLARKYYWAYQRYMKLDQETFND